MNGEILSIETAEKIAKLEKDNKSLRGNCKVLGEKTENQRQELINLNKKTKKLEEANKILSKEITKGNVVGQDMITECCGIPLGDIPKLIEYKQRNKNAINFLKHLRDTFDVKDEMYELLDETIFLLKGSENK